MRDDPGPATAPRLADNSARWPGIAALLAPAADCDCQMLAITIDERSPYAVPTSPATSARN